MTGGEKPFMFGGASRRHSRSASSRDRRQTGRVRPGCRNRPTACAWSGRGCSAWATACGMNVADGIPGCPGRYRLSGSFSYGSGTPWLQLSDWEHRCADIAGSPRWRNWGPRNRCVPVASNGVVLSCEQRYQVNLATRRLDQHLGRSLAL